MPGKTLNSFLFIIFLALLAFWVDLPDHPGIHIRFGDFVLDRDVDLRQGLDLQGGLQVLLVADIPPEQPLDPDAMQAVLGIIENRVNGLGVAEPLIQPQGDRGIIVELPGLEDPDQAIATFGETGLLEFVDTGFNPPPAGAIIQTTGVETPLPPVSTTPTPQPSPTSTPTPTPVPTPAPQATVDPLMTVPSKTPQPTPQPVSEGEMQVYQTVLTGSRLLNPTVAFDQLGLPYIAFGLDSEGTRLFAEYTSSHVNQFMCIVLDKEVISCPRVDEPITTGQVSITRQGGFDLEEATSIVIQLKYGALPVPLRVETNRTVGPTLGEDSVRQSTIAGAIGLGMVVLFMLLYYRLPGLLADLALMIYAGIVLALFKLVPVVLTLAGIAGFILSVGMAVDANILIFERLKEELRSGKGLRLAVETGFNRAWPSIRDSNISTLITSAILFWFGSFFGASIVKGFALTLALGVGVSMFTAIIVTRTFLRLLIDMDLVKKHFWFGI
ncbi:MAG: protein translocase subunit SecD [Chloroflexi bacterium]|nr:protein translocase subunit SecD [Chloroflexota bacterium]